MPIPIEHHQHAPNGRVHLSSTVLRIDDHRRIYRRRPRRRVSYLAVDILFRFVLPTLILVLAAMALLGLVWVLFAIGRAVRSLGGF